MASFSQVCKSVFKIALVHTGSSSAETRCKRCRDKIADMITLNVVVCGGLVMEN